MIRLLPLASLSVVFNKEVGPDIPGSMSMHDEKDVTQYGTK
jgi:hypothetical protein